MAVASDNVDVGELLKRLCVLCRSGDREEFENVFNSTKLDIATINHPHRNRPLLTACHHGNLAALQCLIERGAPTNVYDIRGFHPVHCLAYGGHVDALEWLLSHRADVNCLTDKLKETPLHLACLSGHAGAVRLLLTRYGEDCNRCARNLSGDTPLHYAAAGPCGGGGGDGVECVELLVRGVREEERKEMVTAMNKQRQTPLHRAALFGNHRAMEELLKHTPAMSSKDKNGHTPEHIARAHHNSRCVELLENVPQIPPSLSTIHPSMSDDTLLQAHHHHHHLPSYTSPPSRSLSGGDGSTPGAAESSKVKKTPSFSSSHTGTGRPCHLQLSLSSSLDANAHGHAHGRRPSQSSSLLGGSAENLRPISKDTARRLSKASQHSLQVLQESDYDPPLGMQCVPPALSKKNASRVLAHNIKLLISGIADVNLQASLRLTHAIPEDCVVTSPVCFVSCRSKKPVKVTLALPSAAAKDDRFEPIILHAVTANVSSSFSSSSPLPPQSPCEFGMRRLEGVSVQPDAENRVSFRTSLANPCIFAVGIARKRTRNPTLNIDAAPQTVSPPTTPPAATSNSNSLPPSISISICPPFPPLKCTLFVTYPRSIAEADQASSFDLTVMVGMDLHTVTAAVKLETDKEGLIFYSQKFLLCSESLTIIPEVQRNRREEEKWSTSDKNGRTIKYSEIALMSSAATDSFSDLPYPPRRSFFMDPVVSVHSTLKCQVSVQSKRETLGEPLLVTPFVPKKEPTPEVTPPPGPLVQSTSSQTKLIS